MSQLLRPPRSFWNNTLVFTSEDAVLREVTWQIGKVQKIKAGLFEFVPTDPKKPKTVLSNNVTKRRFWAVVLEKILESPLDSKEIQPVHPKGNQSWIFIGRTDAKAETPILWPPHAKSWLIGWLWCWEGLGVEGEGDDRGWDGWMTSLNGHEFE